MTFALVAAAILMSVRLSKQMAVSRADTSPTPGTVTPTPPEQNPTPPPEARETVRPEAGSEQPQPTPPDEHARGSGGSESAGGDLPDENAERQAGEDAVPSEAADDDPGAGLPEDAAQVLPDHAAAEGGMPGDPRGGHPGNAEPPPAEPQAPPPPAEPGPLDDIRAKERLLVLPPPGAQSSAADPVELAKVLVDAPSECTLSVLGSDVVLGDGLAFVLECEDAEDGTRTWPVLLHAEARLGGAGQIGTFELRNRSLTFAWKSMPSRSSKAARLRYCLLSVAAGGQSERCFLSEPVEIEPPKVKFSKRASRAEIPLDADCVPQVENLCLDLQPEGFPRHVIEPLRRLRPGETGTIRVFKLDVAGHRSDPLAEAENAAEPLVKVDDEGEPLPGVEKERQPLVEAENEGEPLVVVDNEGEPLVEIEVEFEFGDKRSDKRGLAYRAFADVETPEIDGSTEDKRTVMSSDWLRSWQKTLSDDKRTMLRRQKALEQEIAQAQRALLIRPATPAAQAEQARVQSALPVVKSAIQKVQEMVRLSEAAEERGNEFKRLFERLEADGRLGFRIYVEIDGEEVEILRTKRESAGA